MVTWDTIKANTRIIITYGLTARTIDFLKGILLAYYVGANYEMDSYVVAFSAALLLTKIISDSLLVSLIPIYHRIDERDGVKGRYEFTHNLLNFYMIISLILMVLGIILAPVTIKILAPGLDLESYGQAIGLLRLGLPMMIFHFIRAIGGAYLQSQNAFRAGGRGGVANSVVYVIYLFLFGKRFGLEGLMIGGIAATAAQAYYMMKGVYGTGYRYKPYIFLKDRSLRLANSQVIPIFITLGIGEINAATDRAIGSFFQSGTIAELNYANQIVTFFIASFIMAVVTAIYPVLSQNYRSYELEKTGESIVNSLKILVCLTVPLTIILILLPEAITKIFYERGEFGAAATIRTAEFLVYYAIGITGTILMAFLNRVYTAIGRINSTIKLGVVVLIINVVLSYWLSRTVGVKGIALGTSASVILGSLYGLYDINRQLSFISYKRIGRLILSLVLASTIMIFTIIGTRADLTRILEDRIWENIIIVVFISMLSCFIFAITIFATRERKGY